MSRNLRENLGFSQDSTSRLEQLMNDYIEYALVEVDPGHLAAGQLLIRLADGFPDKMRAAHAPGTARPCYRAL